jgi:hypothetical protein
MQLTQAASVLTNVPWTGRGISAPLFATCFPAIFCVLTWAGVFLREPTVRALIPVRS